MRRLPGHCAHFVFGVIQAAMTTGFATAIATYQAMAFTGSFLEQWLMSWLESWAVVLPVVILAAPLIRGVVAAVTDPTPAQDSGS